MYSGISQDIANIAINFNANPQTEAEQFRLYRISVDNFKRAYWGKMSLIEDKSVELAMIIFNKAIDKIKSDNTQQSNNKVLSQSMKNLSYYISHVFRKSLSKTWNPENAFSRYLTIKHPLKEMYRVANKSGIELGIDQQTINDIDY